MKQEENWKIHKYVEIKQHATEQVISQRKKSKGKSKSVLRQMKMETQHIQNMESSKAVLRGTDCL